MLLMMPGVVQMHVGHRQSVRHYRERASAKRFCDERARLPRPLSVLMRNDTSRKEVCQMKRQRTGAAVALALLIPLGAVSAKAQDSAGQGAGRGQFAGMQRIGG